MNLAGLSTSILKQTQVPFMWHTLFEKMSSLDKEYFKEISHQSAGCSQTQGREDSAQNTYHYNKGRKKKKKDKTEKFEHNNKKRRKQLQNWVPLNPDIYHTVGFTFTEVFKGFPTLRLGNTANSTVNLTTMSSKCQDFNGAYCMPVDWSHPYVLTCRI